ncbi:MAG: cohesin domain-containing protein [Halioglobus sp.]
MPTLQTLKRLSAVILLACIAQAPVAQATMLSLQPGETLANTGDTVSLDLIVSGLGAFSPDSLGAFDISVAYDAAVLSFAGYSLENFLGNIGLSEAIDASGGASGGAVNVAEVSLLSAVGLNNLQPGEFVLASLSFNVLSLGVGAATELSIQQGALLADAAGSRLQFTDAGSATIVNRGSIPLPGTLLLLLGSLLSWRVSHRLTKSCS